MKISRKARTVLGAALAVFGVIWFGKAIAGADYSGAREAAPPRLIDISFPTPPAETAAPAYTPVPETPAPTPSPTPEPTELPVPEPPPEKPDMTADAWELVIADAAHPLGDYAFESELVEGQSVDKRIAPSLRAMLFDLRSAGFTAFISSAWRNSTVQKTLFLRAEEKYGQDAHLHEDSPGESEHQTGLCCDITDVFYEDKTASLAETDTLKWLAAHCCEYGFVLRYPSGKEEITSHAYEPWHFRYVGIPAAKYMTAFGLTLEEFIPLLKE